MKPSPWFLYLLLCSDKSIYTGITNDVKKRIAQHNAGKGAKYTRGRGPVKLLKKFKFKNKTEAAKVEYQVKRLNRKEKIGIQSRTHLPAATTTSPLLKRK